MIVGPSFRVDKHIINNFYMEEVGVIFYFSCVFRSTNL
jgi:hypothetical protein